MFRAGAGELTERYLPAFVGLALEQLTPSAALAVVESPA